MITNILLSGILIGIIFIIVMLWAIGEGLAEHVQQKDKK